MTNWMEADQHGPLFGSRPKIKSKDCLLLISQFTTLSSIRCATCVEDALNAQVMFADKSPTTESLSQACDADDPCCRSLGDTTFYGVLSYAYFGNLGAQLGTLCWGCVSFFVRAPGKNT